MNSPTRFVGGEYASQGAGEHAGGETLFIDDLDKPGDVLHVVVTGADHAAGRVKMLDLEPVRKCSGVELVLAADDVQNNNTGLVKADEPVFVHRQVLFHGQPLFAVAADTIAHAQAAALKANVEIEPAEPVITIEQALAANNRLLPDVVCRRGRSSPAIKKAAHCIEGRFAIGGQEHFYLEGQVAVAIPGKGGELRVYSSTEQPGLVKALIARSIAIPADMIRVEARQPGGAFGGKQTQAVRWAVIAALVAHKTSRTACMRLDRDDDMMMTGKSQDVLVEYQAGFNEQGVIEGIEFLLDARCGHSVDLSAAVNDLALLHIDNAYYLKNISVTSRRLKTNTVSSTAFRGFGAPQGMLAIERVMDGIAHHLDLDPLLVRSRNLYGKTTRNTTHYGMKVSASGLGDIMETLKRSSTYLKRRKTVNAFNKSSPVIKRGIALTPVKFGVGCTPGSANHAMARVRVCQDGIVELSHDGVETGQGLVIKLAQVIGEVFQVDPGQVVCSTGQGDSVSRIPSAIISSSIMVNGMAAKIAAGQIRDRLAGFAATHHQADQSQISFTPEGVRIGKKRLRFKTLVSQALEEGILLSAEAEYCAPKTRFSAKTGKGRPFYYFVCGAAVAEVEIDTLTGENRVLRIDILQDCGHSLNPAIDKGQIEGGFIQGMGWLTTEELWWDVQGKLQTLGVSSYKIPSCTDVPEHFNIRIWKNTENAEPALYYAKTVDETPQMLAISVYSALTQAVAAARPGNCLPRLDTPVTAERVLMAISSPQFSPGSRKMTQDRRR